MMKQGIGIDPCNHLLGIPDLKIGQMFDKLMHGPGLTVQRYHGVFHAHEVVGHLKSARSIK